MKEGFPFLSSLFSFLFSLLPFRIGFSVEARLLLLPPAAPFLFAQKWGKDAPKAFPLGNPPAYADRRSGRSFARLERQSCGLVAHGSSPH